VYTFFFFFLSFPLSAVEPSNGKGKKNQQEKNQTNKKMKNET